jgi:hypothetical protein
MDDRQNLSDLLDDLFRRSLWAPVTRDVWVKICDSFPAPGRYQGPGPRPESAGGQALEGIDDD